MTPSSVPAPVEFFQMLNRFQLPQALSVAARLGLADQLANGPRTADELAVASGAHAPALNLLMRALASMDVFAVDQDGRFSLTPLASYLRADAPHSLRSWVLMNDLGYRAWSGLLHTVTTGQPAFDQVFGQSFYAYMASHADDAAVWDHSMDQTARDWLDRLTESYAFPPAATIVDVGGGHGTLLARLLRALPGASGVLFDLPHVVEGARPALETAGVADRCRIVGGDMFAGVPPGGDLYIVARVLFNWDDDQALALLRRCRQAISPDGRLLLIDVVEPDGELQAGAAFGALNLLAMMGGRLRTSAEFGALLGRAGFAMAQVLPTQSHFRIIEGLPQADLV